MTVIAIVQNSSQRESGHFPLTLETALDLPLTRDCAGIYIVYVYIFSTVTGNKDCKQSYCVAESALSGSGATECCVYFLSGCCMPSENDFLHNM